MLLINKHSMLPVLLVLAVLGLRAQQEEKVYKVSDPGITAPKLRNNVQPNYTDEAKAQQVMGTVLIAFEVGKDGKARNARIVRSLDAGLDKNALAALTEWVFDPATLDGEPVTCSAQTEIRFALQ